LIARLRTPYQGSGMIDREPPGPRPGLAPPDRSGPMASARPRFLCSAIVLLAGLLGCHRSEPPAEEKTPPAPVKWEGVRQVVLEEWTELVGTTEPLPDHAARVTAPVEGRLLSVLRDAAGKPLAEGQMVKAGDVLARLDATVLLTTRDKA